MASQINMQFPHWGDGGHTPLWVKKRGPHRPHHLTLPSFLPPSILRWEKLAGVQGIPHGLDSYQAGERHCHWGEGEGGHHIPQLF